MIEKLDLKKTIVLYGTTQTDTDEVKKLAQMIPAEKRVLVDDFCERALPNNTIHLLKETEKVQKLLSNKDSTIIIYGSFYLV